MFDAYTKGLQASNETLDIYERMVDRPFLGRSLMPSFKPLITLKTSTQSKLPRSSEKFRSCWWTSRHLQILDWLGVPIVQLSCDFFGWCPWPIRGHFRQGRWQGSSRISLLDFGRGKTCNYAGNWEAWAKQYELQIKPTENSLSCRQDSREISRKEVLSAKNRSTIYALRFRVEKRLELSEALWGLLFLRVSASVTEASTVVWWSWCQSEEYDHGNRWSQKG